MIARVATSTMVSVIFVAIFGGCVTMDRPETTAHLSERASLYLSNAKDPRQFWLTPYMTDEGPLMVGGHRMHPSQKITLPFRSVRKSKLAPFVEVQGRHDRAYTALIDTASRENWITFDAAMELGATPLGPQGFERRPMHVIEPESGYLSVIPKLRFETLHVEEALFYTRMSDRFLGPLARGVHPRPRLVLGCEFLKALRYVQFDYPCRKMTFSSTIPYEPSRSALIATIGITDIGGLFAGEGVVDGQKTPILLDSVGDFSLVMAEPPDDGVARHVELGDLVFRQVPVASSDELGLGHSSYPRIGRHLLSRFKITIDNKRQLIFFERPHSRGR